MNSGDIAANLALLFGELVDGSPKAGGYMLNGGDAGLLDRSRSCPRRRRPRPRGRSHRSRPTWITCDTALSLLNRWSAGEKPDPFASADWSASWRRTKVSDAEWRLLRDGLRDEASRWKEVLRTPREIAGDDLNGFIGSIAHLAYHLGAIRQIDRAVCGPAEGER